MVDRADPEPVFFAPFVSSMMRVEPQWIDYNGHLNMAYYNVLFDRAVDEVYDLIGLGPDYLKQRGHSTMVAEMHVRYLRELRDGDPVRVTVQLLDYDAKRIHLFEQLLHATEGNPRILRDPAPVSRLMQFSDHGMDLELRFWIADPEAGVNNVRSDVNRAIWRLFRDAGITIPVAQREVYLRHNDLLP